MTHALGGGSGRPGIGSAVLGAGYRGPGLVRNAQQTAGLRLHRLSDPVAAAVTEGHAPRTDGRSGLRVPRLLPAASRCLEPDGATVPVASGTRTEPITAHTTAQERATAR